MSIDGSLDICILADICKKHMATFQNLLNICSEISSFYSSILSNQYAYVLAAVYEATCFVTDVFSQTCSVDSVISQIGLHVKSLCIISVLSLNVAINLTLPSLFL